jgi:hypothetical protein
MSETSAPPVYRSREARHEHPDASAELARFVSDSPMHERL